METMDVNEFKKARGEWLPSKQPRNVRPKHTPGVMPASESDGIGRITLWLPKLPRGSHPNRSNNHWRAVANAKKSQKESAWACAKQVMGLAKPWKAATVQITYYTYRPLVDRDNILAWLKSSFDAFQGVIVDNDSAFTYLPVVIERVKARESHCGLIRLVITRTS